VARAYYRVIDDGIARLLKHADPETRILIVSDHGSMAMDGCFCINQWLASKKYLSVRSPVPSGTPLEKAPVAWDRTTAWGSGGYYARIFFNIRGRESQGIVDPGQVAALRRRLESDLTTIRDPEGRPLAVRVLDPNVVYHRVHGDPPDLMLYFNELTWRSAGTLGHQEMFLRENDTGPDDAVHSFDGMLLWSSSDRSVPGIDIPAQQIGQVAPTILRYLGLPLPGHIQFGPIEIPGEPDLR